MPLRKKTELNSSGGSCSQQSNGGGGVDHDDDDDVDDLMENDQLRKLTHAQVISSIPPTL